MNRTSIEWTRTYNEDGTFSAGYTVNPIRFRPFGSERTTTMCQKISPGCHACYAETIVRRFWPKDANEKFPGYTAQGIASGEFVLDEKQLLSVLKMKKPCKIFWGDMTDLFQDSIPFKMLDKCFAVCALTPHITHMFLTKRPERMLEYFTRGATKGEVIQGAFEIHRDILKGVKDARLWTEPEWPLPSVWYGTSCENQKYAEQRIPILCKIPNATLFISAEPLLSGIELERMRLVRPNGNGYEFNALTGEQYFAGCGSVSSQTFQVNKISLVIIGGESGKNARFMDPEWMRSLRDQCKRWGAACFCKQMGSVYGENKGKNLPDDLNIREFPKG